MKSVVRLLPIVTLVLLCASSAYCLIDINTASQSELESLPGIGEVYAARIIEGRPYRNVNDLKRVKGIGNKTLNKFRDLVTVGSPNRKTAHKTVAKQQSVKVPIYSVEKYRPFKCHNCKNVYKASSDLQSGWCPYCGVQWRLK